MSNSIRALTEESGRLKVHIDEVNSASQEQARGIEQIGKAIAEMAHVTQKSAASAEECASDAEELNVQSRALKDIVRHLSAMVGGERSDHAGDDAGALTTFTQPRGRERVTGLEALHKAIAPKTGPKLELPALAGRKPDPGSFPLGDDSRSSDPARNHSHRKATAGSTAVARRAGM